MHPLQRRVNVIPQSKFPLIKIPDITSLSVPGGKKYSKSQAGHVCSHPRVPRAHQAGFSRRSLAGVGLSESVRYHGPGLALMTNGACNTTTYHTL
ncbi:hypothetical protein TNCV_1373971 [Trichonephila clavipes]|nr:hypothetical protein TNCV_1373971 [Trichonephila clavipes]